MRIGVDKDGVTYDFGHSFLYYLETYHGITDLPYPTQWDIHKDWDMDIKQWLDYFAQGVDAGVIFYYGGPVEESKEYITKLREEGHSIHFCTNRQVGQYSIENTAAWLKEHDMPYDSLTFSADKTIIDVNVFLEDNVANYLDIEASGGHPVLMDRPWNQHLEKCNRVKNWKEFYEYVSGL